MNNLDVTEKLLSLSEKVSKYCVGMEGNISGKDGNFFYIKASGAYLDGLKISGLVKYDFNGNQQNNFEKKGSMELGFHTFLLSYDNINFISHTHPVKTLSILSGSDILEFANKRIFPDQVIFNGEKSCVVPYAKPGDELTQIIKTYVESFIVNNKSFPKLILLQNHGIIACGSTIDECVVISEICEKSAEIFLNVDKINYLTNEDVKSLSSDDKEKYRKSLL